MAGRDRVEAPGALEHELRVDVTGVLDQIQALGSAVEHVVDVLETLTENHGAVDRQLREARGKLAHLW